MNTFAIGSSTIITTNASNQTFVRSRLVQLLKMEMIQITVKPIVYNA